MSKTQIIGNAEAKPTSKLMYVRHKTSGKTALAKKAYDGCIIVQFDDRKHPHAFGWHLYPRHAFIRRYKKTSRVF